MVSDQKESLRISPDLLFDLHEQIFVLLIYVIAPRLQANRETYNRNLQFLDVPVKHKVGSGYSYESRTVVSTMYFREGSDTYLHEKVSSPDNPSTCYYPPLGETVGGALGSEFLLLGDNMFYTPSYN